MTNTREICTNRASSTGGSPLHASCYTHLGRGVCTPAISCSCARWPSPAVSSHLCVCTRSGDTNVAHRTSARRDRGADWTHIEKTSAQGQIFVGPGPHSGIVARTPVRGMSGTIVRNSRDTRIFCKILNVKSHIWREADKHTLNRRSASRHTVTRAHGAILGPRVH